MWKSKRLKIEEKTLVFEKRMKKDLEDKVKATPEMCLEAWLF